MLYPHRLDVYQRSAISDGIGGFTETFSLNIQLSDVQCNMRILKAEELIINDKMSVEATHRVFCSDISITTSDIIHITRYCQTNSEVFDVKTVVEKHELGSGRLHHLEIDVEVIK